MGNIYLREARASTLAKCDDLDEGIIKSLVNYKLHEKTCRRASLISRRNSRDWDYIPYNTKPRYSISKNLSTSNSTQRWKKSERDRSALQTPSREIRSMMYVQFYKNLTLSCRSKWSMRKLTHTQEKQQKSSKNTSYSNRKDPGNPRTNTLDWSAKISKKSASRPTPTSASWIGCTP